MKISIVSIFGDGFFEEITKFTVLYAVIYKSLDPLLGKTRPSKKEYPVSMKGKIMQMSCQIPLHLTSFIKSYYEKLMQQLVYKLLICFPQLFVTTFPVAPGQCLRSIKKY